MEAIIYALEGRLNQAILDSDLEELDNLLSPDLLFTNHLGQTYTKNDDISAHRDKRVKVHSLKASNTHVLLLSETAVVSTEIEIKGQYEGHDSNGTFHFTRIWFLEDEEWRVVAADADLISQQNLDAI